MFSPSGVWQEMVALGLAFGALVFLAAHLTGWPKLGPKKERDGPPIHTGRRLSRGLAKAQRRR